MEKLFRKMRGNSVENSYDAIALLYLQNMRNVYNYIPWTKAAMRPGAILYIVNDIILNNRKVVVEFGAGISTLIAAIATKKNGGHIYSFDENVEWVKIVERYLSDANLGDQVTITHAEKIPQNFDGDVYNWYDRTVVEDVLSNQVIDLMVVDGPTAYQPGEGMSRYPAGPVLTRKLAESFTVILDDVDRPNEAEISREWTELFKVEPEDLVVQASVHCWRRGKSFYPGV